MRKIIYIFLITLLLINGNLATFADEFKQTDLKYGTRQKIINEKYGMPIMEEKIKTFLVPKKKALYSAGNENYIILHFSFGKVSRMTFLEDIELMKAKSIFEQKD